MRSADEAVRDLARRQAEILTRLRNDLESRRLAIIVGAGVTLNVTADIFGVPISRITWTGLIKNGLDYLVNEGFVDESNRRTNRAYEALEDTEVDGLLDAANIVSSQLKQHGQFPTWLESVFGSLGQEVRHPALLDALAELHKRGAVLLTTNYDDILEKHCGLQRIGRSNQDDVSRFRRGDLDGIFHIHGSYHDAHEVVLDTTNYYDVMKSDVVQNLLTSILQDRTILFVGCGSGLEDPNFDALLKWATDLHKNIPHRHCLLIRDGDGVTYQSLLKVKYGPKYEDLAVYLERLLDTKPEVQKLVSATSSHFRPHQNYQIGIICALAFEKAAMVAMLDETHPSLEKQPGDENEYTLGKIGVHNVVIACLPASLAVHSPCAYVARNMQLSFPVKFCLMVGVGGGVWSEKHDVRLGDVIVSQPTEAHGGVIQWDFGETGNGSFQSLSHLSKPPIVLLQALQGLKTHEPTGGIDIRGAMSFMAPGQPQMIQTYRYPGEERDQLFEATYHHNGDKLCEDCLLQMVVRRRARENLDPVVHYGLVASGNQVMKSGTTRDEIAEEHGVICFETEAFGLTDDFKCLMIRGVCDYADSHRNKIWQSYAAATAAAFSRILLDFVSKGELARTPLE